MCNRVYRYDSRNDILSSRPCQVAPPRLRVTVYHASKTVVSIKLLEDPVAKDIMVAVRHPRAESSRAERDALGGDKARICSESFIRNLDEWHNTVKSIINQVCVAKESVFLRPLADLRRWQSIQQ